MSSTAVTHFALNFDEHVRWAMCLRLKPDVLAAIRSAPDASHIRFATEGGRHAIEVGDKTFVLDCREEKPGATICKAHEDWSRGEITEVGVSKLRGDVQTTFAEKQMLAASKQSQSGSDLHERIRDASCVRIPPEKKIPSSAGTHNMNTVIVPMKTLLQAGSMLQSPPVQAAQERPPESAGTSPARGGLQTPPKLTEANGEEVPKATLEEVARVAASHGKLRFCVMALLSARNFRVRRKLGQDVISLFTKGRHDKVPSESTVEMAIKKVAQMSSWGIILTDQARTELLDTVLPQFRAGNWAAASTPIGSPAEGTVGKQPATNTARTGGSKLNPQKTAGKDGENFKEPTGKRKAHDPDSAHKSKKHKKDGDLGGKRKDKGKHKVKDISKEEQRAGSKGASGREGGSGGKGSRKEDLKEEEKKLRKESKRDEKDKKANKRDREKDHSGEKKRDKAGENHEKRDQDREKKKQKVDEEPKATKKGAQRSTEDEQGDKARRQGKSPLAEGEKGVKDGGRAKSRQPSPAAAQHVSTADPPVPDASRTNKALDSAHALPSPAPVAAVRIHSRSPSPAPHTTGQNASQRQSTEELSAKPDVPAKLSSPIPPKVVPPKVAMELLEGDGKSMPAWLETADDGAQDADVAGQNAADKSDEGATEPGQQADKAAREAKDAGMAVAAAAAVDAGKSPPPVKKQKEEEKKKSKNAAPAEAEDDDDDDDFSVGHAAAPPPRRPASADMATGSISVQQGGRLGGDVASEFNPAADPEKEEFQHTWVGRTGTPDGVPSEEGEYLEDDVDDQPSGERPNEEQLNTEELSQYLESVSQGSGQVCLDKRQLERDYKVFAWLVREVQEQKSILQRVPQAAATGAEVVSQHAEALRDFDANHTTWFQKSKLMSLLYHRLKGARNAVASVANGQQQRRAGLSRMA